jgi:hypothetical protein
VIRTEEICRSWPRLKEGRYVSETSAPSNLDSIVNAALAVTERRAAILDRMRAALETGNDFEVINCARQLCGLQNGEKRDRAD